MRKAFVWVEARAETSSAPTNDEPMPTDCVTGRGGACLLPIGGSCIRRLQLLLEAVEELAGEFFHRSLHEARPHAGNRATAGHVGVPVHARLVVIQRGQVHIASHVNVTAGRLATSFDDHKLWR